MNTQIALPTSLLMDHLWQSSLVVILCLFLCSLFKKRPRLCSVFIWVAIAKCLIPPLVPGPMSWLSLDHWNSRNQQSSDIAPVYASSGLYRPISDEDDKKNASVTRFESVPPVLPGSSLPPPDVRPDSLQQGSVTSPDSKSVEGKDSARLDWLLVAFFAVGSINFAAAMAYAAWFKRYLRRRIDQTLTKSVQTLFRRLRQKLRVKNATILVTMSPSQAMSFGIRRPTVSLPAAMLHRLTEKELELVLQHELHHIRRRDSWAATIQLAVLCLWWFNPLVWLLSRSQNRIRELCCDLDTLSTTKADCRDYCRTLLKVLSLTSENRSPVVVGISSYPSVKRRLENALRGSHDRRLSRCWSFAAIVLLSTLFLPGALISSPAHESSPNSRELRRLRLRQGDRIFFVTDRGLERLDTHRQTSAVVFNWDQPVEQPTLSPNAESLAFVSWKNRERRVWVQHRNETPQPISPDHGQEFIRQVDWSPNGEWIAYRTEGTQHSAVYIVKPDGSDLKKLKPYDGEFSRGLEQYNDFAWSPDGQRLAVARVVEITTNRFADMLTVDRKSQLVIHDLSTNERIEKTRITERHSMKQVSWSPDGKWISYVSDRSLRVQAAMDQQPAAELHGNLIPGAHPKWSADSRSLVVHVQADVPHRDIHRPEAHQAIAIVPIQGDPSYHTVNFEIWDYAWLRDQNAIVLSGSSRKLYRLDLISSTVTELADDVGFWGKVLVR